MKKSYRLRDGNEVVVGEYTLPGLLQVQLYPNKDDWGWQSEIWRRHQHDHGDPGHRLALMREDKRARANRRRTLPHPPSWHWEK